MSIILDKVNYVYSEGTAYQIQALKDVNLTIEDGQFIGVIGHTGSGKSTLIQHLNGLMKATSGTIYFHGQDIYEDDFDLRELRNRVGLVFQYPEHQLFETTIFDDVCFGPKNQGLSKEEAGLRAFEALRSVGLPEELYYQSPFDLSGGQKRRVAIAGVLAMKPEVLILDEPTSGLDPGERVRFRNLLSEFAKDRIVVISTHIVSDVEYIANQNAIMKDGKIIENDTTEQLVRLVDGKIWECKIPSSDLVKWERALKLINLRNEADGTTSIRYLSDQAETPDSVSAVPRLEDLYLWLFPQEGEVRL